MEDNSRINVLRTLIPFHLLPEEQLQTLEEKGRFLRVAGRTTLFKRDSLEAFSYWVVSESIDLVAEDHSVVKVQAGTQRAKSALDNTTPHSHSAVAAKDAVVFKMSKTVADLMVEMAKVDNYLVSDVQDTHEAVADWMSGLLSSPLFELVPPANIAAMFGTFVRVQKAAGEAVVTQGERGDYFYVIRSGTAKVEQTIGGETRVLANLSVGATFGEDALISEVPRNATVTMTSPGILMRLSKEKFDSLLHTPIMQKLEVNDADSLMRDRDVKSMFLDVRGPAEYQGSEIADCINIPLLQLRDRLGELDRDTIYITRCDGGKRAFLAAFILNSKGIGAYVRKEG